MNVNSSVFVEGSKEYTDSYLYNTSNTVFVLPLKMMQLEMPLPHEDSEVLIGHSKEDSGFREVGRRLCSE